MSEQWLRAGVVGKPEAVDKTAKVLRGFVVAQEGPFKSEGRGAFDKLSLTLIKDMGNATPKGLKSRLGHPTLSDDGIGKYLGRARDFRLGRTTNAAGQTVAAVRADLHFDPTAHDTPHGDLASYVLNLADSDSDALSSSLVLTTDQEDQLDEKGRPKLDASGEVLPPLWRPTQLHASDLVDTGDAVDGLLSAELSAKLLRFDNLPRAAFEMLTMLFAGKDREYVDAHLDGFKKALLLKMFGEEKKIATPKLDKYRALFPRAMYVGDARMTDEHIAIWP